MCTCVCNISNRNTGGLLTLWTFITFCLFYTSLRLSRFLFPSLLFNLIGHTRNASDSFLRKLHPLPVCVPPHVPPSPSLLLLLLLLVGISPVCANESVAWWEIQINSIELQPLAAALFLSSGLMAQRTGRRSSLWPSVRREQWPVFILLLPGACRKCEWVTLSFEGFSTGR